MIAEHRDGPRSTVRIRQLGYAALAALAYVPVLLAHPGRVVADTKQYLYLDPGRVLARAWSMWDPNIGMGTVTHQNIGYLFPMGPFYWVSDRFGVPDWVAQRIWLGSILLAAALGVLYLFRTIDLTGPGAPVGALAFMLSPYWLEYAGRLSVLLLPWAGLPWMLALLIRGLRRGGWRHAALFALLVQVIGSVNVTALVFAGLGPLLWLPYAVFVTREVRLRRALGTVAKIAVLSIGASAWWISGLWAQGAYGLDILKYTETLRVVSRTTMPNEVLRGLGYWFFYGRDRLGPWIEASTDYTQRPALILVSYAVPILALVSAALVRWRHRVYFVLVLVLGAVVAVGAHPYDSPTPIGALFKWLARGFDRRVRAEEHGSGGAARGARPGGAHRCRGHRVVGTPARRSSTGARARRAARGRRTAVPEPAGPVDRRVLRREPATSRGAPAVLDRRRPRHGRRG